MTERHEDEAETFNVRGEGPELSTADMAAAAREQEVEPATPGEPGSAVSRTAEPTMETTTQPAPLLPNDRANDFRSRWDSIQTAFVDEPRQAVEQADSLVAEVMKYLAATFADERAGLEEQWSRGDNVSTEDLRLALQRYRSFFDRLLSV